MSAVALVTGASRGIGRAIAESLAASGRSLGLVARGQAALENVADELRTRHGIAVEVIAMDLRAPDSPAAIVRACTRALGPPTILVHNAGTAPTARFQDTSELMLEETLDLHVRAPFRLVQAAWDGLRAAEEGTVVLIGSTAGLRGYPFTSAYTAAKHGTVGLARALAAEWASSPKLRSYVVCPGFVDTDITRGAARAIAARGRQTEAEALAALAAMNQIGRLHKVEEVATAVIRLVSDRAAGTILDLDQPHPHLEP